MLGVGVGVGIEQAQSTGGSVLQKRLPAFHSVLAIENRIIPGALLTPTKCIFTVWSARTN